MLGFKEEKVVLARENTEIREELQQVKEELFKVYQENICLREVVKKMEQERDFFGECKDEIERLKGLMRTADDRKSSIPTEREEVKDRIIMKLEDDLITTKIELKEAQLELAAISRLQ